MTPDLPADRDVFAERIAAGRDLAPAARRVIQFIDSNRALALASSAMDIAARTGTSDATVIRAAQSLGFAGLAEVKQALLAAMAPTANPADAMRHTLDEIGPSTDRAIDTVLEAHAEALQVLHAPATRSRMLAAAAALHKVDRIMVFGIGPSAALAGYAAMLLARSGRRSGVLNSTGLMLADQMLGLGPNDGLLILAYGRPYREVVAVLAEARRLSLPIVLITDNLEARLSRQADVVIAVPRGRSERVALHGATLVVLEALALGLAAADRSRALATLDRLNELRRAVTGQRHDVG